MVIIDVTDWYKSHHLYAAIVSHVAMKCWVLSVWGCRLLLMAGIDSIHELDKWMLRKWMNKWGGGKIFQHIYIGV